MMLHDLEFRYGPMGCGKTLDLLRTRGTYEYGNTLTSVLKPKMDTKGGDTIITRQGWSCKVDHLIEKDENIYDWLDVEGKDVILIDEAQFLTKEQVDQLMSYVVNCHTDVICWGLRTNFMRSGEGFEGATRLLQVATKLSEIEGHCWFCGGKATLNGRFYGTKLITEGDPILIDDDGIDEEYHPICENCYNELKYNKDRQ